MIEWNQSLETLLPTRSESLITSAVEELANKIANPKRKRVFPDPIEWLEENYYIPNPRDPITGEMGFEPGPIRFSELQKRLIREALRRKENGKLVYSTVVYSAPKKSGKSAIASAVAFYLAANTDYGQIYCMANDGVQANDRLMQPIQTCLDLHKTHDGPFQGKVSRERDGYVKLDNKAVMRAITVDSMGEAGAEPTGVFFSEIWGYISDEKRRLYTEMTIPPTLYGYALRWVESYAGYEGLSDLLWDIYTTGVIEGTPHSDFTDLVDHEGKPVVWVNEDAAMFVYWDHIPRMAWQTNGEMEAYYKQERKNLPAAEYDRLHRNLWVSPVSGYIVSEWWNACKDPDLEPLYPGEDTPAVLAIDAATIHDCIAMVLLTRAPKNPEQAIAIRAVRIFDPEIYGGADLELYVGRTIRAWSKMWNIVCVAYDQYQMATIVKNAQLGKVTVLPDELAGMNQQQVQVYLDGEAKALALWYKDFSQQNARALADKELRDMIQARRVVWNDFPDYDIIDEHNNDHETLTKHMKQAAAKLRGKKLRIVKLTETAHVDGAVTLSMGAYMAMKLEISATPADAEDLIKRVAKGELTYKDYQRIMVERRSRIGQPNG